MFYKLISISRYPEFFKLMLWRGLAPWILRKKGISIKNINILGWPIITMVPDSKISIANNVTLCSSSEHTALGVNHAVVLRTICAGATISIGEHTGISGGSICAATSVDIGSHCLIGANVTISDTDFHPIKPENRRYNKNYKDILSAAIIIERNVFIGTGTIILKGVSIGENSVIGAGSVVTKSFPKNSILAGNPAKIIGQVQQQRNAE